MRLFIPCVLLPLVLACAGIEHLPVELETPYYFDADLQAKPVFDGDQTYTFHAGGTCELVWESTYDCTWEETFPGLRITAFTGARDPDGNPHAVTDVTAPLEFQLQGDDLVGPQKRVFVRQSP